MVKEISPFGDSIINITDRTAKIAKDSILSSQERRESMLAMMDILENSNNPDLPLFFKTVGSGDSRKIIFTYPHIEVDREDSISVRYPNAGPDHSELMVFKTRVSFLMFDAEGFWNMTNADYWSDRDLSIFKDPRNNLKNLGYRWPTPPAQHTLEELRVDLKNNKKWFKDFSKHFAISKADQPLSLYESLNVEINNKLVEEIFDNNAMKKAAVNISSSQSTKHRIRNIVKSVFQKKK